MANRFRDIVYSVDTLTDLALCDGTNTGQVVQVLGGSISTDGLGGDYRCVVGDLTAADGVNVVAGPNCRWFKVGTDVDTAANVGGGTSIFKAKNGTSLEFKSLVAGTNVTLTPTTNTIVIDSSINLSAQLSPSAPATAIHVYVATTGNDSNPGTIGSPKATLAGAYQLLPIIQTGPFIIHMASGSYTYTAPVPNTQCGINAFICIYGDGAGQGADDGFTVVATGAAEASSTIGVVKATGLSVDAYAYRTIEITSGASAGSRRLVAMNTATDIAVSHAISPAPSTGDTYRIIRPAVVFTVASNTAYGTCDLSHGKSRLHFANIAFTGSIPISSTGSFNMSMYGVEFGGTTYFNICSAVGGGANAGESITAFYLPEKLGSGFNWEGWGITTTNATVNANAVGASAGGFFHGYLSSPGIISAGNLAEVYIRGGRYSAAITYRSGFISHYCQLPIYVINPSTSPTLRARGRIHSSSELVITCSANSIAIHVEPDGDFQTDPQGGTGTTHVITSSATSQPVILVESGGRFYCDRNITIAAPSTTAIQSEGDLTIGGTLTVSSFNAFGLKVVGSSQNTFKGAVSLTGTSVALSTDGSSAVTFDGTLTTSSATAFQLSRCSKTTCNGTVSMTQTASNSSNISRTAELVLANATINGGITLNGTGALHCSGTFSMTGTVSTATIIVQDSSTVSLTGSTVGIANTGAGDAVRCNGNGAIYIAPDPTISSSAAYGVNCRGGGRLMLGTAPTSITGTPTGLTVGTSGGDDFATSALSASYAVKTSGASIVGRAT